MAVTESLGSKELSVAGTAVNLTVGSVTGECGVQGAMALSAVEALLMPHCSLGQLLFSSKHSSTATGATLALGSHDRSSIGIVEGALGRDLFLANIGRRMQLSIFVLISTIHSIDMYLRQTISLEETSTTTESVTVGSPLLAIASTAVDIPVRSIATNDRVQLLCAILALVALAMPLTTLGQDLLGREHNTTATRATLSGSGLDDGCIDDSHQWGTTSVK